MSIATLLEDQVESQVGEVKEIDQIPDSDSLYEFVGSTIKEKNVGATEVYTSYLLARLLSSYVETMKIGQVVHELIFDFRPTINRRRRPDAAFISAEKWPFGKRPPVTTYWKIVPDLAIEVVSPSDAMHEVLEKVEEYFQVGVRQVWLVAANVEKVYAYESPTSVRVLGIDDELEAETLIPGFRLSLRTLFQDESEIKTQA
ncbi:MAG: hypothetical protein NVSMB14_01170 [Isosphaeraceae bacterium]